MLDNPVKFTVAKFLLNFLGGEKRGLWIKSLSELKRTETRSPVTQAAGLVEMRKSTLDDPLSLQGLSDTPPAMGFNRPFPGIIQQPKSRFPVGLIRSNVVKPRPN
jgi:hypothetical protein